MGGLTMFFMKPSLSNVVFKQYNYKLKAYYSVFSTLIIIQLLALLFSLGSVGMSSTGFSNATVTVSIYSADIVVVFTFLWAFIIAILMTTKAYRNDDFTFITNRLSHNLANFLFIVTASMIGGITAILSRYVLQVVKYYSSSLHFTKSNINFSELLQFLIGISATSLYVLLFSALGYLIGTIVQRNKLFAFLIPTAFIGLYILGITQPDNAPIRLIQTMFQFVFFETSFPLFLLKVFGLTALMFASSIALSNRLEVGN